jgi:hypothetical protein
MCACTHTNIYLHKRNLRKLELKRKMKIRAIRFFFYLGFMECFLEVFFNLNNISATITNPEINQLIEKKVYFGS